VYAGAVDVLEEAMRAGAGPLAHASVDVMLQLLQFGHRTRRFDDDMPLLTRSDGFKLMAEVARAALQHGALQAAALVIQKP